MWAYPRTIANHGPIWDCSNREVVSYYFILVNHTIRQHTRIDRFMMQYASVVELKHQNLKRRILSQASYAGISIQCCHLAGKIRNCLPFFLTEKYLISPSKWQQCHHLRLDELRLQLAPYLPPHTWYLLHSADHTIIGNLTRREYFGDISSFVTLNKTNYDCPWPKVLYLRPL